MRKKLAAATTALVAAFALCSAAVPAQAASLSGSGTQADPYLIANAEDLAQFRDIVNEGGDIYSTNAKLTADIDLQGSTWVPIGLDNASPFYGSFDGQGHVIRNMHVDMSNEESPAGLFSEVFGSIHNLGVLNATVTGTDMVGAIAGSIENSDDGTGLFNCWSDGGTVTGRSMVGGLVGNMRSSGQATITGSYNGNHVIGYENGIGGVVGWVYNASVIDSHNAGNVEAAASEYVLPHEIGGVIGGTADDLHNVYNIGSVTAQDNQYGAISGTSDGAFNSSNLYYLNGTAPSAFAEGQDGDAHAKSIADFENLAVVLHALYSAAPEIWLNTRGQVGELLSSCLGCSRFCVDRFQHMMCMCRSVVMEMAVCDLRMVGWPRMWMSRTVTRCMCAAAPRARSQQLATIAPRLKLHIRTPHWLALMAIIRLDL
ncbi:hypothetical protein [Bifidobacterium mongoliense]|uniref:Fibronectin type III domain-containing protein n=1 Tax=Bifidobacterium mongoliense DSM 21395 TaxID=1437603 RepID=A0A087BR17_9BIFI|nr:hypothetical protein [Bifidobacterium mongoliense]KFI73467.1 fibronectin type III domain-containing protein [Bifidobacterium mongoliense DSM 21395]